MTSVNDAALLKLLTSSPKALSAYENSHPGRPGMTIVERLTRDLDEAYAEAEKLDPENPDKYEVGIAEGIAHSLGVMRNSSCEHEWEQAVARYARRHPA
jgi:hypothetical protein